MANDWIANQSRGIDKKKGMTSPGWKKTL